MYPTLSTEEREVMEHAVGFRSREPFYRNHFVAGDGHDALPVLKRLVARGLMRRRDAVEALGVQGLWVVTQAGKMALSRLRCGTRRRGRC